MCGIFCIKTNQKTSVDDANNYANQMFKYSETRGKEAAGLAIQFNNRITVYKKNIPASEMIRSDVYNEFFQSSLGDGKEEIENYTMIGHSRLVTNGSAALNINNQPVIKDNFVGINNGIVRNLE